VRSVCWQTAGVRIAEIVVIDDNSTDGSRQVLEQLACDEPRLRLISTKGIGAAAARNLGIRTSSAPLIAFLDGDDYWRPDKLERQLAAFTDDRVGLVYSDFVDFTRADLSDAMLVNVRRFTGGTPETLADYFVHDAPIIPSTAIIARAVFSDVGFFDESLYPGEDTEMCLRIAERWQFQHVPGGLTFKRRHAHNITRHLETLLPINLMLTQRFVARNPSLQPFVGQRLSRRYARVGHDCSQHGHSRLAFSYLCLALSHAPFFWRSYAYLVLLILPWRARTATLRVGKRLFHGGLYRLRISQAR